MILPQLHPNGLEITIKTISKQKGKLKSYESTTIIFEILLYSYFGYWIVRYFGPPYLLLFSLNNCKYKILQEGGLKQETSPCRTGTLPSIKVLTLDWKRSHANSPDIFIFQLVQIPIKMIKSQQDQGHHS